MDSRALSLELIDAAEASMVETLRALGVTSRGAIATGLYVGRQRVTTLPGEPLALYEPDEFGTEHIIVPVIESGTMMDLLAFHVKAPARWWLRTGYGAVLGQDVIDKAEFFNAPEDLESLLRIFRTPLSWLQAECTGAVILDWRVAHCRLDGVRKVVAEDVGLAEKIERAFAAPRGPTISIPRSRAA